jgi:hypothetical protein
MAIRSSSRVGHARRLRTFFCSSAKNDSMAALSAAVRRAPRIWEAPHVTANGAIDSITGASEWPPAVSV